MSKVKLELSKKTAAQKIDLGKTIVSKMTGNATFATPNPPLAAITTAITNLSAATAEVVAARKTVEVKMIAAKLAESTLDSLLTQEGNYVENISNGDEAKILSAGMDVRKDASAAVALPDKVASVNATIGDSAGEIDLSWDKIEGAKSYVVETALSSMDPLEWKHMVVSTRSKAEVNTLKSGVSYHLRVAAVGSVGQGPWSDPVVKVAP
ncbi:fibronectin type III domain protein [Breznakibacter xylanolyticus]|uniref:Fibronectin type III domain protein n=1 Tax=Breznakibacter xylanolyticus TaxID=990 RepID=A0A2W7P329_9BACT|nr:fibronectin type III domain-containing protein [Breznakibacter xylanolyticus]PZX17832.1 fibronectin type III domain protein [Breznakibacter xylanolyticus]